MALADHLAVEVGVENVNGLGVLAGRWLEDVVLVEFEPKPNQVIVQILAWLQLVPFSSGDFDLAVANALLVIEHGHGDSVVSVPLVDQRVGVVAGVELDAGNLDCRHLTLVRQFLLVQLRIERVRFHGRVNEVVLLGAHGGLGGFFL